MTLISRVQNPLNQISSIEFLAFMIFGYGRNMQKNHDVTFGSNSGPSYDLAHGQVEAGIEQAAPSSFGPSEKKLRLEKCTLIFLC